MPLVAKASKTVRNKNLLIVLMCAGMGAWFAYDGWIGWPERNDRVVAYMKNNMIPNDLIVPDAVPKVEAWKGWNNSTNAERNEMTTVVKTAATKGDVEGWKSPTDIFTQQGIVAGLAIATLGALWWFLHCQKRRAIAEEATVSPAPGIVIPWGKITVVDNTRWKKTGIVDITYTSDTGDSRKTKFDDYELEREMLLPILDQLSEKAVNAEFLPKEEPAQQTAAS